MYTSAPFPLQPAQSWTVVPRSTFGELPVRFLPSTFRFRVLVVIGRLLMITLFNCEPLTSSGAYHLWVPSAFVTLKPRRVGCCRISFHFVVSANVNLPITAGYPVPASFAPLWATTASMLAVVLFCVLLKVVVLLPVAALTVTVPLMQCPFRLSPVSCVPSMV